MLVQFLNGKDLATLHSASTVGLKFCSKVIVLPSLSLPPSFRIDNISRSLLASMTDLRILDLSRTNITNEGLQVLNSLTALTTLSLSETRISDSGLDALRPLTALKSLSLNCFDVTDAGLPALSVLTSLTDLELKSLSLTPASLQALSSLNQISTLGLSHSTIKVTGGGMKGISHYLQRTYLARLPTPA